MRKRSNYYFYSLLAFLVLVTSCEEIVEVGQPRSQLPAAAVFDDDLTAIAAVSALYSKMAFNGFIGITLPASLSADELLTQGTGTANQFYQNEVLSTNPTIESTWRNSYTTIYNANSIIEGLEHSDKITISLKNQLMGEAKFFRAFSHFYLTNFFGDVPYITATDYRKNELASRLTASEVCGKIISDLAEARNLLAEDYSFSQNEKVRVNKWVATALLARVYLYQKDWGRAEELASRVIEKSSLYTLNADEDEVFLKNSSETIWQCIPIYPQNYTTEGSELNTPFYSVNNATISAELFNAFEANDERKIKWVGVGNDGIHNWYYSMKYKESYRDTVGADEYSTVFRLAEQYLIRAEARAKLGKLIGPNSAESDVNMIRSRAGLLPTTASDEEGLLLAIEQERRVELFTEWGHRWFDMKRTGRAQVVLSASKPHWNDTDVLYPIPFSELQLNPNLKPQNDGY